MKNYVLANVAVVTLLATAAAEPVAQNQAATALRAPTEFALGEVPFALTSSWNTPVPANAVYTALNWPAPTGYNYTVAWDSYSPAVYLSSPSDPLVQVTHRAGWGYPEGVLRIRIPAAATGAAGTDGELVVIDGDTVHSFWQFNRTSPKTATAQSYGAANVLTGNGWGSKSPFFGAGTTAAGSSMMAGLLIQAETDAGQINHALQLSTNSLLTKPGYTGEAISGDGKNSSGLFQEGARLAIPPGTAMPSAISPLGQKVFRAYQKYGAYVIHVAHGTSHLRAQSNAYDKATIAALRRDMNTLTPLLQMVR